MDYDNTSLNIEPVTDLTYAAILEADWDWRLGRQETLKSYLETKIDKPDNHYYWIMKDNLPVGVLGLNIHPDHNKWQTIIFLNHANRGKGLNTIVHKTLAEIFTHTGVTLIASIDENNAKSRNSFKHMIGNQGEQVWEPTLHGTAYVYVLTEESFLTSSSMNDNISETVEALNLSNPQIKV